MNCTQLWLIFDIQHHHSSAPNGILRCLSWSRHQVHAIASWWQREIIIDGSDFPYTYSRRQWIIITDINYYASFKYIRVGRIWRMTFLNSCEYLDLEYLAIVPFVKWMRSTWLSWVRWPATDANFAFLSFCTASSNDAKSGRSKKLNCITDITTLQFDLFEPTISHKLNGLHRLHTLIWGPQAQTLQ